MPTIQRQQHQQHQQKRIRLRRAAVFYLTTACTSAIDGR
jgi:hypothetical protein